MFLLMHIILCSSSYSSSKKTRKLNVQNYHLCGPNNYDSLAAGPIIFQIRYVHCVCISHFFECFFLLRSMTTIQQTARAMTKKKFRCFLYPESKVPQCVLACANLKLFIVIMLLCICWAELNAC